jgi:LysM repeat protein
MHVETTTPATPNTVHQLNPGLPITTPNIYHSLNPGAVIAGTPDWQHFDSADTNETAPALTNEPAAYRYVDVKPGEHLADLARRVYGTNNVLNRLKIELANGGNVVGTIKVPK